MAAFASKFTHINTIVIGTSAVCVCVCVRVSASQKLRTKVGNAKALAAIVAQYGPGQGSSERDFGSGNALLGIACVCHVGTHVTPHTDIKVYINKSAYVCMRMCLHVSV